MSTAIVSAFYDVGDVLYQVQKNRSCHRSHMNYTMPMDRKIVGSPIMPVNTNSNKNSGANSTSALGTLTGTNKLNLSVSTANSTNMISYNNMQQLISNSQDKIKKLNHTMSEPPSPVVGERNNNHTQTSRSQNSGTAHVNSPRYKTELCRPFEENGHCKYGDKCQFAHGACELKSLPRHPKYKSERCRTFHTSGFCPYGPRCHFIHNEDELKLIQLKQKRAEQQRLNNISQITQPPLQQTVPQYRSSALNISYNSSISLGSTGGSPPSSVTDSPSMSPTFMFDIYDELIEAFSPTPVPTNVPVISNTSSAFSFNLHDLQAAMPRNSQVMAPLNIQTHPYGLQTAAASLKHHNQQNDTFSMFQERPSSYDLFGSPSPPGSSCGDSVTSDSSVPSSCSSLLDVSRGLRLPIFSQLSEP